MTALTLNGMAVQTALITMPIMGVWHADVTVVAPDEVVGNVFLSSPDASFYLSGTVFSGAAYNGVVDVRIVGGAGGLGKPVKKHGYQLAQASLVVSDILTDVGEQLDPSSLPALSAFLRHWATPADVSAERALSMVASELGLTWRVQPNGLVWFGTDTFPETTVDGTELDRVESRGEVLFSVEYPTALPGIAYQGRKVNAVTHCVGDDGVSTRLYLDGEDRFRGALKRVVQAQIPNAPYFVAYEAVVVSQGADGSLDVVPDTDVIAGMQNVPLYTGIPGLSLTVGPGSRVLLHFQEGDPSKPVCAVFKSGTLLEMKLTSPSVQLGTDLATPVAHAIEALAGMLAIAAPLAAIHSSVSAATPATPVTNGTLASFLAPLAAIPAAVSAATATMPTITTRIA